jgi:hypothetical protein
MSVFYLELVDIRTLKNWFFLKVAAEEVGERAEAFNFFFLHQSKDVQKRVKHAINVNLNMYRFKSSRTCKN